MKTQPKTPIDPIDQAISHIDLALKTLVGGFHAKRPVANLVTTSTTSLSPAEQAHAAGLMRVNHVGEVCAQALYSAQSLVAKNNIIKQELNQSALEEMDHLAWCEMRLHELNSHLSYLNPLWYAGAFGIGLVAGVLGDKVSLGFVAETEKQVEAHLNSHLEELPAHDLRSRAIVTQMRDDEIAHGQKAKDLGGTNLPSPITHMMSWVAKVMTKTAYHI